MFDSPIDEIKQKIDIVDLIQEYIPLRQAGANFKANCPFHQEKTPSFMVSRERQIFKCFGCQEGGDIFKFIMKMEGLEFGDALRHLAKKAGVVLKRQDPQLQTRRAKILEILELASQFYHQALLKSQAGEVARQYVKERKIDDLACDQFRLGFAPDRFDELYKFLKKKDFKDSDILDSGLVVKKQIQDTRYKIQDTNFFDRFRHRLMFPIFDVHNNVIGFGGRILPGAKTYKGEEPAKYINTPQTFVYDKSRVLYGLNFAKFEIRKQKRAVVVEGYMDVIASHQAGVTNVVAASGTALTLWQIQFLKRYSENIILAFDMDLAGDSATKRGIDSAISCGLNVKIAFLPEGKDPDELIKNIGKQAWQKAIDDNVSIMDYYFKSTFENLDLEKVENKKKAAEILLPVIAQFPNPIEQAHYLQRLAKKIFVSEEDLRQTFENLKIKTKKKYANRGKIQNSAANEGILTKKEDKDLILKQLFSLVFHYPQYFKAIKGRLGEEYLDGDFKILYKNICQEYNEDKLLNIDQLSQKLKKIKPNLPEILGEIYLYYEKNPIPENEALKEIEQLVLRFCESFFKKRLQEIEEKMIEAEKEKDSEKIKTLSLSFSKISNQLHNLTLQKNQKNKK
ncbi:MAG: DNA primase [Patescibacteria group bacterium]